jgi:hypothetical protein
MRLGGELSDFEEKGWDEKRGTWENRKGTGKKKDEKEKVDIRRGPDSNRRSRRNKISSLAH